MISNLVTIVTNYFLSLKISFYFMMISCCERLVRLVYNLNIFTFFLSESHVLFEIFFFQISNKSIY